jgi:hypothetical protein
MPTTTTTATPTLQSPPIVNADGSIDLVFNTAMAAGSGTIIITDGAIQTVIDRATGLPTMRVVGANDTHTVSASSVGIEGTHVKLNVPGLLPGHEYSIVMASGVLASSDHVAFGGIRSTSQAPFTVPSGGDTKGPSATIELDGNELLNGGSIGLTITLTDKITDAAVMANLLSTPNAAIVAGSLSSADGGLTWKASLQPGGSVVAPVNAVTLDLSSIRDANGHAGSIVKSGNYQVDPTVAAFVEHEIGIIDWYGPSEDDHVSSSSNQSFNGTLSAALQEHQHLMLSIDGGDEFEGWTDGTTWGDSEDGMRFEDGTYSVTARVVDDAHHASASFTQHFTIDTVAPIMLSSPNGASGNTGTDFVFTFNEAMYLIEGEGYSRLRIEDNEGKVGWIDILPEWLSADRKTLTVPAAQLGLQDRRPQQHAFPHHGRGYPGPARARSAHREPGRHIRYRPEDRDRRELRRGRPAGRRRYAKPAPRQWRPRAVGSQQRRWAHHDLQVHRRRERRKRYLRQEPHQAGRQHGPGQPRERPGGEPARPGAYQLLHPRHPLRRWLRPSRFGWPDSGRRARPAGAGHAGTGERYRRRRRRHHQ